MAVWRERSDFTASTGASKRVALLSQRLMPEAAKPTPGHSGTSTDDFTGDDETGCRWRVRRVAPFAFPHPATQIKIEARPHRHLIQANRQAHFTAMQLSARTRSLLLKLCMFAACAVAFVAPLHALSHAMDAAGVQQTPKPGHVTEPCDLCLQLVGVDTSLPATAPVIATLDSHSSPPDATVTAIHVAAFAAYRSRAPPLAG